MNDEAEEEKEIEEKNKMKKNPEWKFKIKAICYRELRVFYSHPMLAFSWSKPQRVRFY